MVLVDIRRKSNAQVLEGGRAKKIEKPKTEDSWNTFLGGIKVSRGCNHVITAGCRIRSGAFQGELLPCVESGSRSSLLINY
jgi:hypothetical protein